MRSGERESPSVRWALANALTVVADKSTAGEIQEMLGNSSFRDVHAVLKLALKNLE